VQREKQAERDKLLRTLAELKAAAAADLSSGC
jgi:hypothetical protein